MIRANEVTGRCVRCGTVRVLIHGKLPKHKGKADPLAPFCAGSGSARIETERKK